MPMDLLRKYMWLWVIAGILFVSLMICLIFLLINKCISRGGKHRISQLHRRSDFSVNSNKYQEKNFKADIPPLPPRTQFLTAETQSYENLTEVPNHEQSLPNHEQRTPSYKQDVTDYEQSTPDYEQSTPDYEQSTPDYEQNMADYEQSMPDYEQDMADYEQNMHDYVKVEDEDEGTLIPPPPPPYMYPDPEADNASTEDYDDIGGEDEFQGEEDYDDVG